MYSSSISKQNSDIDTNREWKFLVSLGHENVNTANLPSNFTELYISSYDISDEGRSRMISTFIPYEKLADTRQTFYSGYYWKSDNTGAACLSISKTEIRDYGVSFNGVEVSSENRRQDVYYR